MNSAWNWRRFNAMLLKETLQMLRDPSTFLIAFVMPLVMMFLFGYGINLDTSRTRIGLSLQDNSAAARSLAGAFQSSKYFEVVRTEALATLKNDLVAGRVRGVVVIPQTFGRQVARGGGDIQVLTDGSSPNTASFVSSYAEGLRANWAASWRSDHGKLSAPLISIEPRYWFNSALASRYALVPGAIAIVMTMIGSLLTALVIAREWERGTMEAIMATPISMGEFIATKVVPYFLLGLGSMAMCTLMAIFLFGLPFRGSVFALIAIVSCYLVPALGIGLFISAATKNQFVASQIALITAFLPAMLLSGFIYEIQSMPAWVRWLTIIVPARYLVPPLRAVFIAGDNWALYFPNMAAMLGIGTFFFFLALRTTKRRIA